MGLPFLLLAFGGAVGLFGAAAWRARRVRPPRSEATSREVGSLDEGRFRVVGRIVPMRVLRSAVDGSDCVYVDVAEYRAFGGAVSREVAREIRATPFFVDDGTGLLLVDPREAEVDAVEVCEDLGLTAERRLRVGEEVEVVGAFRRVEVESEGGPYRGASVAWSAVADGQGLPRISYRTAPEMVIPGDELAAFFRGAAVLLVAAGTLIALFVGA
ncbi:MAG: hypothetical protein H6721_11055 [Sandaracinus sp.]|nr:hypothetical protein [Sandaracinus sp.]MCB9612932.1 hypothetical protein [Sandaracinus sp.]MCB9632659.1 hypothetical protein [Sandaracinus sp.]